MKLNKSIKNDQTTHTYFSRTNPIGFVAGFPIAIVAVVVDH